MDSKALLRFFVLGAVAAGIASIITLTRDELPKPRLVSVKPADKRTTMPAFVWPSTGGHKWSLAEHRGKVIFVNFWATWCGPCRSETPELVRVYEKYRGRGVTFAGISMDQDPSKVVPKFADHYRIEYPILIPADGSPITEAIESIPTSFLVDQQGRVARTWVGMVREQELTKNIEELLAEGGVPQQQTPAGGS
jgi:cytochrome c biogenesis protein CcmG/thiol:disulfide interchange protein DsbE